jgi:radical SAM family uncharacterized protein
MCPFWRRQDLKILSLEEEKEMMRILQKAGITFMGFEGGEPLLRADLGEILRFSHQRFLTSLVTNGWLLKQRADEIVGHLDRLFVSLDGLGEVHDTLRGVSGAFDRAIQGIEAVGGEVPTVINVTVTRDNVNQVPMLVKLADRLNVKISFEFAHYYSTAENLAPVVDGKFRELLYKIMEMKFEGYPIVQSYEFFRAILDSKFGGKRWKCKPWLTINIDPEGNLILPCYVMHEYVAQDKNMSIFHNDVISVVRNTNWNVTDGCNNCTLACYLEPSLFSYRNAEAVVNFILKPIIDSLAAKFTKRENKFKVSGEGDAMSRMLGKYEVADGKLEA